MDWQQLLNLVATQQLSVIADSRKVEAGCVFVALPGSLHQGVDYLHEAKQQGAKYLVSQVAVAGLDCIVVSNARQALGALAQAFYGEPAFPVYGVTGTNGKTTITYLLEHLLTSLGKQVGVLGTVAYRWPNHWQEAPLTTPGCLELHQMLADMAKAKVDAAVMEVSSHALAQERLAGIKLSGAIFSNLTQDHLDYHKDMQSYFKIKSRLFHDDCLKSPRLMAIGTDNPWGQELKSSLPKAVGFGLKSSNQSNYMQGTILNNSPQGLHLGIRYQGQSWELHTGLLGAFSAENLLAVQALAVQLNIPWQAMACFNNFTGVPGRLERIENAKGLNIYVDYAHTPDALMNVLSTLRATGFKRIITVFGAGGNRDKTKRPLMGQAVAQGSDVAVLTSDNPRNEDPEAIMADVWKGLDPSRSVAEVDRKQAIIKAVQLMQPEDVLLVAGKGHEATQQIGDIKYPFSDQAIIREIVLCS